MLGEYGKQGFVSRDYKVAISYHFSVTLEGLVKSLNLYFEAHNYLILQYINYYFCVFCAFLRLYHT